MVNSYKKEALRVWKKYNDSIFQTEEDFLEHLFFVNGNGYEWVNGCLVIDDIDNYKPKKPKTLLRDWKKGKSTREIYPLSKYSKCITFESDIKDDWLEQLIRALKWADSACHIEGYEKSDHEWLEIAKNKVKEIQRGRK